MPLMEELGTHLERFADDNPDVCQPVEAALAALKTAIAELEPRALPAANDGALSIRARIRQGFIRGCLSTSAQAVINLHQHISSAGFNTYDATLGEGAKRKAKLVKRAD